MRKRIAIAVVVVLVVSVLVYVVSQPERGSVEWHKREYLAAANGPSKSERMRRIIGRLLGRGYSSGISNERKARMERHQSSLIRLGFLEQRDVVFTNLADLQHAKHLQYYVSQKAAKVIPADRMAFTHFAIGGADVLTVVAAREDMPVLEKYIRQADEPEGCR